MKHSILSFTCFIFLFSSALYAQHTPVLASRLEATVESQKRVSTDAYWSAPDIYGTPRVLKLARQGDVNTLRSLTKYPLSGQFLLTTDSYNNNLFHVAKDADTVQAIALLLRHFYGAKATQKITQLANANNALGERPLNAQINAAHTDTFRLIYRYTTLKQKNDIARRRLTRLHGSDPRIFAQHKAIYCQDIIQASSANGVTLLQAAQAQVAYHPQMAPLASKISRLLPCLAEN